VRWILIPLLASASATRASAQTQDSLPGSTLLRLSADATRTVPPDYAVLRLGINTEDKRAADAGRANARLVTSIMAALRQSGIPLDSVSTGAYAVQPGTRDRLGHVTGYVARAELSVVLHDLEQIGAVIDAALEAGATDVAPVSFAASSLRSRRPGCLPPGRGGGWGCRRPHSRRGGAHGERAACSGAVCRLRGSAPASGPDHRRDARVHRRHGARERALSDASPVSTARTPREAAGQARSGCAARHSPLRARRVSEIFGGGVRRHPAEEDGP
jgi:hypothetical protein